MDNLIEKEVRELYEYCKEHGYGHTMELISALWRYDFKKKGYPTGGCFVTTLKTFIREDYRNDADKSCSDYDKIVEKILGKYD